MLEDLYDASIKNLDRRIRITDEALCASILDPAGKQGKIVKDELLQRYQLHSEFLKMMYQKFNDTETVDLDEDTPNIQDLSLLSSLERSIYNRQVGVSNNVKSSLETEIERYLAQPLTAPTNVLEWWGSNMKSYPCLSELARVVLQIPASAAEVEEVFSISGRTISKSRSRMHPLTAERSLVVKRNFDIVKDVQMN